MKTHRPDYGEGEEGVKPHAGRHADRPVRNERHDDRAKSCRKAGGNENSVSVHTRSGQNVRVHEDDVRHRQEGRHAGNDFRSRRSAVFL